MGPIKCCVVGCESNDKTHRLYCIPKDDQLRSLWLSFLLPVNPLLSGLSKDQLVKKRVCQKHFDRHQLDSKGDRLPKGYPCLFSKKEIHHEIPLCSFSVNFLEEHNYCKADRQEISEIDIIEEPLLVTDHAQDHFYCATDQSNQPTPVSLPLIGTELEINSLMTNTNQPSTSQNNMFDIKEASVQVPPNIEVKVTSKRSYQAKSQAKTTKNLSKLSLVKEIKKQALAVKKKPFNVRLANAKTLSQDNSFLRSLGQMNKQAQNFIMMQLKSSNKKKKGVRFTDDEKLLALTLMKESPKGYRLLQKIFILPSKRTLNRLGEKVNFGVGINENIFRLIKRKATKWDIKKKICSIVFDEVALTPHLTYVEAKDEIKGFKDLGDQRYFSYSDHALVFMLRGVCSNWKQPICYYFCEGTTSAAEVKRILQEVVAKVSESGLIPVALVCDQGTTFRSAIKMFREDTEKSRNQKGENNDGTIEVSGLKLSVVFDPPHLLKGIRNNFLTKDMIFNGALATWQDILTVYRADCQLGHTRMNKKLTDHHVIPSKIKKMKVNVAAQVLSEQTSALLKYTSLFNTTVGGEEVSKTMKTTGEAVGFMDNLFDSVNGSKRNTKKGKMRGPVTPSSNHFEFWRGAIKTLKNIRFIDSASKRAVQNNKKYNVRVPSLDGWVTTLESFDRIANLLFKTYGLKYFYPRFINQDPLENFFGRIRAINYRNNNPNCYTFVNAFKSLLISNVMGPHSIYANCEDDEGHTIVDFFNLLKEEIPTNNDDKENIPVNKISVPSKEEVNSNTVVSAINERVGVHSCAYTAGYLCRKIFKRFNNCRDCLKTLVAVEKENIHQWILHREYKRLKNSNLAYPSKRFLIAYREISNLIHRELNQYAHNRCVGKLITKSILEKFNLNWLGCFKHKVSDYYVKLILRLHIHNWCNIINKILKGDIEEKYVLKMNVPQKMAFNKYKVHRLRNKKK